MLVFDRACDILDYLEEHLLENRWHRLIQATKNLHSIRSHCVDANYVHRGLGHSTYEFAVCLDSNMVLYKPKKVKKLTTFICQEELFPAYVVTKELHALTQILCEADYIQDSTRLV